MSLYYFCLFFSIPTLFLCYPSKIPIQSFTAVGDREQGVIIALNFSTNRLNNAEHSEFFFAHRNRVLRTAPGDTWAVIDRICTELQQGFMLLLMGEGDQRQHEPFQAVSSTLEIPLINWELTPNSGGGSPAMLSANGNLLNGFEVSLQCPNAELIADLIVLKKWQNFIYVHDYLNVDQAMKNLENIYSRLRDIQNASVQVEILELPRSVNEFGEFLRVFNLKRFHENLPYRIVLDASNAFRQQQLLEAIRSAQFNQINYHYVVANYDFMPYDVEMFENSNINITGFQIIDRESHTYDQLKREVHAHKLREHNDENGDVDAKLAFIHDALIVAKKSILMALRRNDSAFRGNFRHGEFFNRGYPGIYCHPANDRVNPNRLFVPFEHGRMIAKAARSLELTSSEDDTLTGTIEFDHRGIRKNFLVTVIDLMSNSKSAFNKKEGVGFTTNRTVAQHTRKTIYDVEARKKRIKVATVLVEPFVMLRHNCEKSNSTECAGNNRFEGFCIDLLKYLSDRIENFDYDIFLSNKYGAKQPDGSWDGLIGHLLRGEADVVVASLTINQDRERVVDFSKPYMTTGISIMIKKPDKEFSVFSFLEPLSSEIWMYIIFAYVGVSVVIFLVSRFSPYEWRVEEMANGGFTISNDFSVYNCLWFTLAAFMQQGTDILPRSISGRIASSAWWFFTMIIVSSYTANLAAFLTLEKMQAPIESVEDLAKQSKIKYGIQQGGSTAQFFKHSSVQVYQRMWKFMESQVPSVFTSSYAEGIERVRSHKGRYAFLLEATANEYANTRKPCDTMKVGANLNSVGYGVATPFGSKWKDFINLAILALQERGELKKLENKWWYDRGQCDPAIDQDGSSSSLNLSKVAGIFYILIGGMIASMLAALAEFLYRSRIEARKGQISSMRSLRASFCGQLRLSLQGNAIAKEGSSAYEALKKHKVASLLPANYAETNGNGLPMSASSPKSEKKAQQHQQQKQQTQSQQRKVNKQKPTVSNNNNDIGIRNQNESNVMEKTHGQSSNSSLKKRNNATTQRQYDDEKKNVKNEPKHLTPKVLNTTMV